MKTITMQQEIKGKRELTPKLVWAAAVVGVALLSYALLMSNIRVSLWPHTQFFTWFYGMEFEFVPGTGYVAGQAGLAITGGCMGARLFVSTFLIATLGFLPEGGTGKKAAFVCKAYALSLAGALLVSLLRISLSLPFLHTQNAQLIHNIISLVFYFGCTATLFFVLQRRQAAKREKEGDNDEK